MRGYFAELLQKPLGHEEILLPVFTGIVELLAAQAVVLQDRIRKLECRIDEYPVETVQLLGIHTAHGSAQNKVGAALRHEAAQQRKGLVRIDRQVGREDLRLRQEDTERPRRAAASAGRETVDEQYGLARHQGGTCELV